MRPSTATSSQSSPSAFSAEFGKPKPKPVQGAAAEHGVTPSRDFPTCHFSMTPSHSSTPPADDTRELLQLIAKDTGERLGRWVNLSSLLSCPVLFPPATWRSTLLLANEAVTTLRAMQGCAKEAIRCFRKHRYDRCMREMEHLDRLRRVLDSIDSKVKHKMLRYLMEGGNDDCRH